MMFFRRGRSDGSPPAPADERIAKSDGAGQGRRDERSAAGIDSEAAGSTQGSAWDRFSGLRPVQTEKPGVYRAGQGGGNTAAGTDSNRSPGARSGSPPNYYTVLGVPRNATRDQVERAYRKYVVRIHPDKFFQDPKRHMRAAAQLRALNAIMQVLRDPDERARYDATLDGLPLASRIGTILQKDRQAQQTPPVPSQESARPTESAAGAA